MAYSLMRYLWPAPKSIKPSLVVVACTLLYGLSFGASANVRCAAFTDPSTVSAAGQIKVSPGVPIGTVLFRQELTVVARCGVDRPFTKEMLFFHRENLVDFLAPGLSVFVTYKNNRGNTLADISTGVEVNAYSTGGLLYNSVDIPVIVEVVKTGVFSESAAIPSTRSIFTLGGRIASVGTPTLFTMATSLVQSVAKTCEIKTLNQTVKLAPVMLNKKSGLGSGVNSTSPMVDFEVPVVCEQGIAGNFDIKMSLDGQAVPGFANIGVLQLDPGSEASGVGVQVLRRETSLPVVLGEPWKIATYSPLMDVINVPFKAGIIQTGSEVVPGSVAASATLNISYL
ncbi:MAG: fimbrial protein [Pseudomonas sp.]|nr:fimbrial protein [Pseudomonas sp.]